MAIVLGTSLGLCTKKSKCADLNEEKQALYAAAQQGFENVLLLDPQKVLYFFERGQQRPRLLYGENDISDLSVLLIRSTGGREVSSALLAHTLVRYGCNIVDPVERFSIGFASKLLTTIDRFEQGVGSSSYIAFGKKYAERLLQHLHISAQRPILYKPATGKKGKGLLLFSGIEEAQAFVRQTDTGPLQTEFPFLFQTLERFVAEYRIIVLDGNVLGVVQKVQAANLIAANAAQGGTFVAVTAPKIIEFVRRQVSKRGLLGVDVAIDDTGALHLIETNRAPMWSAFQAATGINVAKKLIRHLLEKVEKTRQIDQ